MTSVGIIANPASGRDIRRLVAHGSVFDNNEKVNIVRFRFLHFMNTFDVCCKLFLFTEGGDATKTAFWEAMF
jgi:predicted polyphosphate/ATP-dependent NAD kinase